MLAPTLRFPALPRFTARRRTPPAPPTDADDATRDRRRFITDMMDRNPHAFASEQDVQNMMHCFPGRF